MSSLCVIRSSLHNPALIPFGLRLFDQPLVQQIRFYLKIIFTTSRNAAWLNLHSLYAGSNFIILMTCLT